jgi:hypothetical protein
VSSIDHGPRKLGEHAAPITALYRRLPVTESVVLPPDVRDYIMSAFHGPACPKCKTMTMPTDSKVKAFPGRQRALHAAARATFIKILADSTVIRTYRTYGPWGNSMDIMERFYIAAAALGLLLIAAMALL